MPARTCRRSLQSPNLQISTLGARLLAAGAAPKDATDGSQPLRGGRHCGLRPISQKLVPPPFLLGSFDSLLLPIAAGQDRRAIAQHNQPLRERCGPLLVLQVREIYAVTTSQLNAGALTILIEKGYPISAFFHDIRLPPKVTLGEARR